MLLRLTIVKTHRYIIYITTFISQLYSIFFFFLFVLQCLPSAYFWTQYSGGEGTCINPNIIVGSTYGYSVICCVGDWIFAILPVFMVWDLQMNKSTKASVAGILAMGAMYDLRLWSLRSCWHEIVRQRPPLSDSPMFHLFPTRLISSMLLSILPSGKASYPKSPAQYALSVWHLIGSNWQDMLLGLLLKLDLDSLLARLQHSVHFSVLCSPTPNSSAHLALVRPAICGHPAVGPMVTYEIMPVSSTV